MKIIIVLGSFWRLQFKTEDDLQSFMGTVKGRLESYFNLPVNITSEHGDTKIYLESNGNDITNEVFRLLNIYAQQIKEK